jgi:hypothetical protein
MPPPGGFHGPSADDFVGNCKDFRQSENRIDDALTALSEESSVSGKSRVHFVPIHRAGQGG